jgi:exodeoxyribonuclease V alpha subunit
MTDSEPTLLPEPHPPGARSGEEWLEGTVERVLWAADDGSYAVVRVRTTDAAVTVVGPLGGLSALGEGQGGFVAIEGRYEQHALHGTQFRATGWLPGSPRTLAGLELWLGAAGIPGVGEGMASKVIKHFGMDALRVLDSQPSRLRQVKGLGRARADAIAARWAEDREGRAAAVALRGMGLSARLVERVRSRYGARTQSVVTTTPYRLAEEVAGIGFRIADGLAAANGIGKDDPARARAAVAHVLGEAENDGHCFLPRAVLARRLAALEVPEERVTAAIAEADLGGRVVVEPARDAVVGDLGARVPHDEDRVWGVRLYRAEVNVAMHLRARVAAARPVRPEEVASAARYAGVVLDPQQQRAVAAALGGGVVVVTGGPGTGKTTLVKVLLRAAVERGEAWMLASPTGRASRRLEEATGQEAKTLHRLLEVKPGEGFARGPERPLEGDGLVIDEVSMVDVSLLEAVIEALPEPPFSLVLVGDADQLPSVGPGQVLRDLITSGVIPVVRLERVFRQSSDSGILSAALAVHAGEVPVSGERSGHDDVFLVARTDSERAARTVVQIVQERLAGKGYDPFRDVQVLTPIRRGPMGTEGLNRLLQAALNPGGAPLVRGEREIRSGDRVLCTRNTYALEVFNGDTGRVLEARRDLLRIDFDGRVVDWPREELPNLDLGYAVTVHKAQGSEYPAVVLALDRSHGIMLRRALFYTAITRARRFLCVVGDPVAWARAASVVEGGQRYTGLGERLQAPDRRELPPWM